MGKLIGIVMVVTVLAVWLAVWLLPVYVLILASVLVNPRDWREIKWSLRVTSFASGASGVAGTILTQGRPGYISDPVIDTAKR